MSFFHCITFELCGAQRYGFLLLRVRLRNESSRALCDHRFKNTVGVDACLMATEVAGTLPIGADASRHWLNVLKCPSRWNGMSSSFAVGLLNPEKLLATAGLAVLDQHFIFCNIKMLMDEMKREAIKFSMFFENRTNVIHAGEVCFIKRLTIVEILRIHPLHGYDG
ncbi:hypothetical protein TZ03_10255 [Pseudomonas sp. 10-1B]|nr:hypothetical protein TZ03_10255 [Pseudomonas sp. 10-1B]